MSTFPHQEPAAPVAADAPICLLEHGIDLPDVTLDRGDDDVVLRPEGVEQLLRANTDIAARLNLVDELGLKRRQAHAQTLVLNRLMAMRAVNHRCTRTPSVSRPLMSWHR